MLNTTTGDIRGYFKSGAVFGEKDIEDLTLLFQLEQLLASFGLTRAQKKEYNRLAKELDSIAELDDLIVVA